MSFLAGGYLGSKSVGTVNNAQDLQWNSGAWEDTPSYGYTGGAVENFVMEITGYYFAR